MNQQLQNRKIPQSMLPATGESYGSWCHRRMVDHEVWVQQKEQKRLKALNRLCPRREPMGDLPIWLLFLFGSLITIVVGIWGK